MTIEEILKEYQVKRSEVFLNSEKLIYLKSQVISMKNLDTLFKIKTIN